MIRLIKCLGKVGSARCDSVDPLQIAAAALQPCVLSVWPGLVACIAQWIGAIENETVGSS